MDDAHGGFFAPPSTPSFFDASPLRARSLSLSVHIAVPPPSLLDDDPFANLSPRRCNSPVSLDLPALSEVPPPAPVVVSPATVARPRSSGHGQVRPAYTRPAFGARPSLPSLHTLAQMNVSAPSGKIRKGTPGARLPHEPWDMDLSAELDLFARNSPSAAPGPSDPPPVQADPVPLQTGSSGTSREIPPSLADETVSSRSLSGDDADMDSLPSLSYSPSQPSSSALSRSSSVASEDSSSCPPASLDVNTSMDARNKHPSTLPVDHDATEDDDPLSYHSDFDYYTQPFSDLSDSEPDLDTPPPPKLAHHSGVTSLYDPLVDFGSGSSSMRTAGVPDQRAQTDRHLTPSSRIHPPQDGEGWRGQPCVPEKQPVCENDSRGRDATRPNAGCPGGQFSGAYSGGAGDNGDRAPRGGPRSSLSTTPDYTSSSSSDDDADGITVYYSLDGMSNGPPSRSHSRTHSRHSKAGGGSDDDVPLAQQVPTALSAQRSIRKQLHDERQQRRLQRAKSSRGAAETPVPVPCQPTELLSAPAVSSRFRKRSMSAAPAPGSVSRTAPTETFPVEELTRKLMSLQTCSHIPPLAAPVIHDGSSIPAGVSPWGAGHGNSVSRTPSRGRYTDHTTYYQQKTPRVPEPSSQDRSLRPVRSFHRLDGRHSETQRSPVDQTSPPRLGRSVTAAAAGRTVRAGRDAPSAAREQHTKSSRVSEEARRPSATVPRSSIERENDALPRAAPRPPVPPLPISDSTPPQITVSRGPVVQQRIFIGDMQRFNMVEIAPSTNAGGVIDTVAKQGMLDRSGSWMVFELAQDYGMERPVRDYELLADVSASWNKDKLLNAFVIKQTPLAPLLSRSAVPTSSPTFRGWVEWESKRGKWSKRWMELREHGLWLSKRETGKDEVFLCSLSNFDAYFVTRRHKSPKGFVFAIKSTDHLSMFENAADYLHVFCCNPKDGERWMQATLVARSYVLYQERNVLFAKTSDSLSQAKPLARSRTRKQSVSIRPVQPLVNVPPPSSQAPNIAFEPGSLLAKRKEIAQS